LLPMLRGDAYLREEIVKLPMAWFYNRNVKEISIKVEDLVLWKMKAIEKGEIQGKLDPIRKGRT